MEVYAYCNTFKGRLSDEKKLNKYALAHGYDIVHTFYDNSIYSRIGIYRLLNKIEHTNIKTIIVYSLDHLWGDEELHYMLVLKLKSIGANIKCITEPQYSIYSDDITKECNSILKYLNRLLPSVLSAKMARGRTEKAENGYKPNGRIPLGYKRNQSGNIVIDDKEAEIVRLIFKQYLYCNSLEQLRLYLSEHHIISRRNIPFKRETLRYILHNDFYIGIVTYGHKKIHGHHKPIIDKRMFYNVQNALSSNRNCTNK